MSIKIQYRLSQSGQKAQAALGLDAQRDRTLVVEPPYTAATIAAAHFDESGNGKIDLADRYHFGNPELRTDSSDVSVYGQTRRGHAVQSRGQYEYSTVSRGYTIPEFDNLLTATDVDGWLTKFAHAVEAVAAQITVTKAQAETQARQTAVANLPALIAERDLVEDSEERVANKRAEREAKEEAQKESREADRAAWIGEHGSERLKLALAGGYKCNALYLQERVDLELLEGWEVDTGDKAEWDEKVSPSFEALQAVQALPQGFTGEVVWLTRPPNERDSDCRDFESCEAVKANLPFSGKCAFKSFDC